MPFFQKLKAKFSFDSSESQENNDRPVTSRSPPSCNPIELGNVHFYRDIEEAYRISENTGKPIFMLFQEIPGCLTCTSFGRNVLQNENILQCIETQFVPLAINNRCTPKHDKQVCQQFQEPALNNPVLRFIDQHGKELIPRKAGVYSAREIHHRMVRALQAAKR